MEIDEKKVIEAYELIVKHDTPSIEVLNSIESLLKDALAPEPRFYVGQPVLVSQNKKDWHKGHFDSLMKTPSGDTCGYQPFVVWNVNGTRWHHCKPDPDAVSLPNWKEHDGSERMIDVPKNSAMIVIGKGVADQVYQDSGSVTLNHNATRYCIIPLPQFLDQGEK
jgi:hypothetical protein